VSAAVLEISISGHLEVFMGGKSEAELLKELVIIVTVSVTLKRTFLSQKKG
jgi:hypothetical protein